METEVVVSEEAPKSLMDALVINEIKAIHAERYFEQGRRAGKTARLASLLVGLDSESPEGDITAGAGHSDEDWERITAAQRKRERKLLRNKINEGVKDFRASLVPVRRYTKEIL